MLRRLCIIVSEGKEMNKLSIERQAQIVKVLCEGNSIRATARITDSSINTVVKLLKQVGDACLKYQDHYLRHLHCERIECDEIWNFCYAKEANLPEDKRDKFGYGDIWTFVAIDATSKLIVSWLIGERDPYYATIFAKDVRSRVDSYIQLSTDGHRMYYEAVKEAFHRNVDFGMIVKHYGVPYEAGKYSPARIRGITKKLVIGKPDTSKISTSYVERQNLSMRTSMRRFTRLTNGFSKKIENQKYATALYFMYYNYARVHKALANPYPHTPAMVAGLTDHIWEVEELVKLPT